MAGHGDLLDATWEAAIERGIHLERLDGIEIDENTATACRNWLSRMAANDGGLDQLIVEGDASIHAQCKCCHIACTTSSLRTHPTFGIRLVIAIE